MAKVKKYIQTLQIVYIARWFTPLSEDGARWGGGGRRRTLPLILFKVIHGVLA